MVKVISLTGSLAHAGEHGISVVLRGDVADQLLNQNRLAHACAAEQTDLSALLIGAEQIHHLDARLQQILLRGLLLELGRGPMDGFVAHSLRSRLIVNGLTQNVEDPPQCLFSYRNGNGRTGGNRIHAPHQTVGAAHGDTSHGVIAQMLGDLHGQLSAVSGRNANRFVDLRQLTLIEADVQHRTDDLRNLAPIFYCHFYLFPARLRGHVSFIAKSHCRSPKGLHFFMGSSFHEACLLIPALPHRL